MPNLRRMSRDQGGHGNPPDTLAYGVAQMREYVSDMSQELAVMARAQGDERLACLLEVASDVARNSGSAA